MSDDKLRAAFNAEVARSAPKDRSACPTPEQLQALAESGQGGDSANLKTMDHIFGCAYCRADFALLRSVRSGVAAADNGSSNAPARRSWFNGPRIAIAASILFAIGIGNESLRRTRTSEVRNASEANDVVLVSPPDGSIVAAVPTFVWRKVPGAAAYEVQLVDTTGVVITTQITSDTVFIPNAEDRARIAALKSFDWFVSARRSDGNERRSVVTRVQLKTSGQP